MKLPLKTHQRQFALHRMAFGFNLLSPDVAEALQRACLARIIRDFTGEKRKDALKGVMNAAT
jgi:hypothetical protein